MMPQMGGESFAKETERSVSSASSSTKEPDQKKTKRARDEEDEFAELTPQELAPMSRMEKKRYREKKRRYDLNKGFDGILNLLVEIDPVIRAEVNAEKLRRRQDSNCKAPQDDNIISRVELFDRTIQVLQTLHRENEMRKTIINQLIRKSKDEETLSQALPTLAAASGSSGAGENNPFRLAEMRLGLASPQLPQQSSLVSHLTRDLLLSANRDLWTNFNPAALMNVNASLDTVTASSRQQQLAGLLSGMDGTSATSKNMAVDRLLSHQLIAPPATSLQSKIDSERMYNLELQLLQQQREQLSQLTRGGFYLG